MTSSKYGLDYILESVGGINRGFKIPWVSIKAIAVIYLFAFI